MDFTLKRRSVTLAINICIMQIRIVDLLKAFDGNLKILLHDTAIAVCIVQYITIAIEGNSVYDMDTEVYCAELDRYLELLRTSTNI